jgi:hypothetical protein
MAATTDFLEHLLPPARARVLRLFILHSKEHFTPAEVARRASVTAHSAKSEIDALKKMGIIKAEKGEGRAARYGADLQFKHQNALSAFVHDITPAQYDHVERALKRTGRVTALVLSGVFVGDMTRPADLLVVGDYMNEERLEKAVRAFEPKYGREIRYAVFSTPEFRYRLTIKDRIIHDMLDYPHRVLINKHNLL